MGIYCTYLYIFVLFCTFLEVSMAQYTYFVDFIQFLSFMDKCILSKMNGADKEIVYLLNNARCRIVT